MESEWMNMDELSTQVESRKTNNPQVHRAPTHMDESVEHNQPQKEAEKEAIFLERFMRLDQIALKYDNLVSEPFFAEMTIKIQGDVPRLLVKLLLLVQPDRTTIENIISRDYPDLLSGDDIIITFVLPEEVDLSESRFVHCGSNSQSNSKVVEPIIPELNVLEGKHMNDDLINQGNIITMQPNISNDQNTSMVRVGSPYFSVFKDHTHFHKGLVGFFEVIHGDTYFVTCAHTFLLETIIHKDQEGYLPLRPKLNKLSDLFAMNMNDLLSLWELKEILILNKNKIEDLNRNYARLVKKSSNIPNISLLQYNRRRDIAIAMIGNDVKVLNDFCGSKQFRGIKRGDITLIAKICYKNSDVWCPGQKKIHIGKIEEANWNISERCSGALLVSICTDFGDSGAPLFYEDNDELVLGLLRGLDLQRRQSVFMRIDEVNNSIGSIQPVQ